MLQTMSVKEYGLRGSGREPSLLLHLPFGTFSSQWRGRSPLSWTFGNVQRPGSSLGERRLAGSVNSIIITYATCQLPIRCQQRAQAMGKPIEKITSCSGKSPSPTQPPPAPLHSHHAGHSYIPCTFPDLLHAHPIPHGTSFAPTHSGACFCSLSHSYASFPDPLPTSHILCAQSHAFPDQYFTPTHPPCPL